MTWNESWSCSNTTITRLACTKGYPATRPKRKRAGQHLSQPVLKTTVGKAIAMGCLNCQSPLEWQFAMYRPLLHREFCREAVLARTPHCENKFVVLHSSVVRRS